MRQLYKKHPNIITNQFKTYCQELDSENTLFKYKKKYRYELRFKKNDIKRSIFCNNFNSLQFVTLGFRHMHFVEYTIFDTETNKTLIEGK